MSADTEIKPDYRGKVRDIYNLGEELIIVASDRVSAFDVVFDQKIPDKGKLLTRISNHWFSLVEKEKAIENHLIETEVVKFPAPFDAKASQDWQDRAVLVKKANRIDFECVVRGYLMGSGFKEYQKTGEILGNKLPPGLTLGAKLPQPIFTPATKADEGHDENVTFEYMQNELGEELATKLRKYSLDLYNWALAKAQTQGLLLLDTKLEFGLIGNEIILIDEIFTPDSSRFCTVESYDLAMSKGESPPSIDKQVIRDYVETTGWNKKAPAPALPEKVVKETLEKYSEIEKKVLCIS